MKKLMTMIAAVATAFGLFADEPTTYNGTSFETGEGGVTELKWTPALGVPADAWTTTIEGALDLGAYATEGPAYTYASGEGATNTRRNDQFVNGDQNLNFLKLDTGSATVDRAVATAQVFFDQVIKFTGFEDMQTNFVGGTKIALWTSAIEPEEAEGEEGTEGYVPAVPADTNLYVAVGTGAVANPMKNVKVAVPANFDFNAWHRVTIKNAGKVSANYLGFFVWIDGVMAQVVEEDKGYFTGDEITAFKSYYEKGQLFISMDGTSATVANIGFQGVGSLDDVVVDADGPAFAVLTVPVTIAPLTDMSIESVKDADGNTITADDQGKYNVAPDTTITITFAPGTGKMFKNGNTITKKIEDAITINPATEGIETADIIATVVIDGGDTVSYYDFGKALEDIMAAESDPLTVSIDVEIIKEIQGAKFGDNEISLAEGVSIAIDPVEGSWTFKGGNVALVADVAAEKSVTLKGTGNTLTYGGIVAGTLQAVNLTVADSKTISLLEGAEIITKTTGLEKTIVPPTGYQVVASEPEDDYITYTVEAIDYVAQIGDDKFETLAEAVEAAQDGNTIELLKSCSGAGITIAKNLTIDFGGFSYSGDNDPLAGSPGTQSQVFNLKRGYNITLKNGTITTTIARMLVQNYASLTLDNMILDGTGLSAKNGKGNDYVAYTLSNCAGNTVITGNTVIKARVLAGQKSFAFDTYYKAGKYEDATVTVNGATITGDIELSGGSLTLTAGTLNGALVEGANIEKGTVTKDDAFDADAPAGYKWVNGVLAKIEYATLTITAGENVTAVVVTNAAGVAVEDGAKFDKDDAVVVAVDLSRTTFADNFELDAAESTLTVTLSKDDEIIVKAKAATPAGPTSEEADIGTPDPSTGIYPVTPKNGATEVVIENGEGQRFSFPSTVKTIKGVIPEQVFIQGNGGHDITPLLTKTGDATTGVTYDLNPEAKDGDVPVKPTIEAVDTEFDIAGGTMEVKGIQGLYYSLVGSEDVKTVSTGAVCDTATVEKTGDTVSLTDEGTKGAAKFYVIKVSVDAPAAD